MKQAFSRAAVTYDEAAALARETGRRLGERLSYTKIAPARMADVGCATGDGIRELRHRYPKAQALAIDFALPMLHAVRRRMPLLQRALGRPPQLVQADVRQLALAGESLGLIWSNLVLHWLDEPLMALRELYRVMEVGGLITFAVLGPDTAKEWRAAATAGGMPCPGDDTARQFLDMHEWGDMLVATGFADPVMDREDITLTYRSARRLLADQRHLGVRDALLGRVPWREARRLLAAWPRDGEGRLPLTFEIIYGQAWKAAARQPKKAAQGYSVIHFKP